MSGIIIIIVRVVLYDVRELLSVQVTSVAVCRPGVISDLMK